MAKLKEYTFMMKNGDVHKFNETNFKQATDRLREAVYHAPQIDFLGATIIQDLVDNVLIEECQ